MDSPLDTNTGPIQIGSSSLVLHEERREQPMTNKDMVPRPGTGPAPRSRTIPKGPKGKEAEGRKARERDLLDPPDSPQLNPSQDRK
jgi:hypothetical protein